MLIVADTSALIAVAVYDGFDLLDQLFDKVVVPASVFRESTKADKPEAQRLALYLSDKVAETSITPTLSLPSHLGEGEVDAMRLYQELKADMLLLDDLRARKVAKFNHIKVMGSLGLLLLAKRRHLIESISPYLTRLEQSNIHIADDLLSQVKATACE